MKIEEHSNIYRVFYWDHIEHRGEIYKELKHEIYNGKLENYPKKNSIYYLTDINGDIIIDNREER